MAFMIFGALVSLVGHPVAAVGLAVLTGVFLVFGSGLKRNVLGEPLMFSDVAVIGSFIRHPRFYIGAIPLFARVLVVAGLAFLGLSFISLLLKDMLWSRTSSGLAIRVQGVCLFVTGWLCLDILGRAGLARRVLPVADLDVGEERYGLLATIILGWLRWKDDRRRKLPDWPQVSAGQPAQAPLIVVIQCESFADPREFGVEEASACVLPHLLRAEREGDIGKLQVSGFGAYTMRTEYGVLFGHEESELGFRRFDPYLTAGKQPGDALAARLTQVCEERVFLHPHDLKFYGRDVLMPAMGFNRLIGTGEFVDAARCGVHIADQAVGDRILEMIDEAVSKPSGTFIFTVTIENHGPWSGGVADYLYHVRHGDELLGRVTQALGQTGRDALLVFYGDHRPSLSGAVMPGGARHTPVVVKGFGTFATMPRLNGMSLTPAALHHRIIRLVAERTAS
ncbi:capsule biosynthesis protein [Gluconobacter thailandicus]|uniref:LTA synthase family protein n=1 Tax=Gluconobacter thailandicus TaxID=257438 RepID=UPI0007773121|nr:LTA synthase family protein [Gluconobacter thailandicus]KXV32266.1 capsule biosynthesis protein [Gluconobacter thailandicus]